MTIESSVSYKLTKSKQLEEHFFPEAMYSGGGYLKDLMKVNNDVLGPFSQDNASMCPRTVFRFYLFMANSKARIKALLPFLKEGE